MSEDEDAKAVNNRVNVGSRISLPPYYLTLTSVPTGISEKSLRAAQDKQGTLERLRKVCESEAAPVASGALAGAGPVACLLADPQSYWLHLRASPTELQELVEAVVVPETWFFRDPQAFSGLAAMARSQLVANPARAELRLLSLPCSTGEEPFSMAMAMIDADISPQRFRIDAIDISLRALEQAARASYGSNSFRGQDLDFRSRHFSESEGRWQPCAAVRQSVKFQQGNLFAPDFLPGRAVYDYIFCRNVVIYFDPPTQARTLEILLRLLTPDGCLFVGPSETGLLPRDRLVSAQLPMAFAFRRAGADKGVDAGVERRRRQVTPPGVALRPRAAPRPLPAQVAAPPLAERPSAAAVLARVQDLADQGRLVEAAAACEDSLKEYGPSAPGYHLLGLIREASGQADNAAAMYRKALYLQPDRGDTLAHLALLLEKQGKRQAARVLRERLQRLEGGAAG